MLALTWFFAFCAIVGGTILICQFVLTLVGLGGDDGFDVADDIGGAGPEADAGSDGHDGHSGHGSSWMFAMISFRTLVAAAAFFGITGLAAQSAQQSVGVQLLLGVAAGAAAMYGVHWMVSAMGRLGEDGTVRVKQALGQEGTVYIPIPPNKTQHGKIQLKLENRLVEYEAVTSSSQRLATGTKVRVVGVNGMTLEVEPLHTTSAV